MTALVLKPLDTVFLSVSADCIFALALGRPKTIQNLFTSIASDPKNLAAQVTVEKLVQCMAHQQENMKQKLLTGVMQIGWGSPGLERYPSLSLYRQLFIGFVMESRSRMVVK
jgi:hypothetical protein